MHHCVVVLHHIYCCMIAKIDVFKIKTLKILFCVGYNDWLVGIYRQIMCVAPPNTPSQCENHCGLCDNLHSSSCSIIRFLK